MDKGQWLRTDTDPSRRDLVLSFSHRADCNACCLDAVLRERVSVALNLTMVC